MIRYLVSLTLALLLISSARAQESEFIIKSSKSRPVSVNKRKKQIAQELAALLESSSDFIEHLAKSQKQVMKALRELLEEESGAFFVRSSQEELTRYYQNVCDTVTELEKFKDIFSGKVAKVSVAKASNKDRC
jgi:hypothetical protein